MDEKLLKKPRGRPFGKKKDVSSPENKEKSEFVSEIFENLSEEIPQTSEAINSNEFDYKNGDLEAEEIDKIDFVNGNNVLSIRFGKKKNRVFRIQMVLNESFEVRPMTYNGSSAGYTFWNLLKGAMKK